ncbi:Uncharacterised protein [Mycobacterium tuberculosis]|uniref:Uncharacterized protein n=1 Tax=Mycobacterium tuberculosis TaxID=1773 RepID=A0A916LA80_MYCTX|nr:Uncharacterised protein [Mycobacterium tuberculosis]
MSCPQSTWTVRPRAPAGSPVSARASSQPMVRRGPSHTEWASRNTTVGSGSGVAHSMIGVLVQALSPNTGSSQTRPMSVPSNSIRASSGRVLRARSMSTTTASATSRSAT